jgi:hypothetical protein
LATKELDFGKLLHYTTTMKGTIKEITTKLNKKCGEEDKIGSVYVNGFLRVMVALGKAKVVGVGPAPKRGRSPKVYELEV